MATPATPYTLSVDDIMKDAQRIREFNGDGSYALTSFIREVDTVLPILDGQPQVKNYVLQRIIINKIQGAALDAIRTLGTNLTWDTIKAELINNFGIKESYHQLYHKALAAKNYNVRDFYISLKIILSKLNEKYAYDEHKPSEFNPQNNEVIILRTFLDNIDPNLSSVVISRDIKNLREAYNILETSGLIRIKSNNFNFNKSQNFQRNQQPNQNVTKPNPDSARIFNKPEYNRNNTYQHRPNNPNQYRQNNANNSYQYRQNYSNNSNQFRRNQPEPMIVDHVQQEQEQEVNFQLAPLKYTYR